MDQPKPKKPTNVELLNRLRDVLGGRRVSRALGDRLNYSHDLWPRSLLEIRRGEAPYRPDLIIWPETTEEVSRVLKVCNEMRTPVVPFGAGSGMCGGVLPVCGGVVLDTKRMNHIERISEESQVAVCQTGILGIHLEQELNRRGYTMGHFPGSFGISTLGGYLATRSAGQAATMYGKIEDMVLSLQAVLADGTVIHTRTAPRRATGPDFNHVLLGSEGVLAVITRAHMRLHALPAAREFRSAVFPKLDNGLEALRLMLRFGLRPTIVRLSDPADTSVTMKALGLSAQGCLLVMVFDGRSAQIELESAKALEICLANGGRDRGEEPARHWYNHRFAEHFRQSPLLAEQKMVLDTIELAATWTNVKPLYDAVHKALGRQATVLAHVPHAYPEGCALAFTVLCKVTTEDEFKRYDRLWQTAMDAALKNGGVISHAHGIGRQKVRWLAKQLPLALPLLQGLKRRLDPNNILNPGKLSVEVECPC
jgi:alkyldihydroxyacetonephosphate synthase